jgi:hypothetical protein
MIGPMGSLPTPSPANLPPNPEFDMGILRRVGGMIVECARRVWDAAMVEVEPRSSSAMMSHLAASGSETALPDLLADARRRTYS